MRKFKGDKLSRERDFPSHASNFDYLRSCPSGFQVTLDDIPTNELLATAASVHDDTFYKLGLRKHTPRRQTPEISSKVVKQQQMVYPNFPSPTVPRRSSGLMNEVANARSEADNRPNNKSPNYVFKTIQPPEKVHVHKDKLTLDLDYHENAYPRYNNNRSTDSLLLEIIETYSEINDQSNHPNPYSSPRLPNSSPYSSPRLANLSLPDLVRSASISNSSIDTVSQFSFEEAIDDNEVITKKPSNTFQKDNPAATNKPLPPIPVRKISQSKYRDYSLKKEMTISLDPGPILQWSPKENIKQYNTQNKYIMTRTGGDNFVSSLNFEQVNQAENDLDKFTRKYSNSSSNYSSISSDNSFQIDTTKLQSTSSRPGEQLSSNSNLYPKRNQFSPRNYKRDLTPINEKKGYEPNKTRLCVIN